MITFETLRFKNFLSYGNYWTTFNFTKSTNTCIIGTNGNGKSVLLDALCFALFGKPFRDTKKPLLVNSINRKDCVVEINFSTFGKNYKVIRGISPNIFEIYVDGVLKNQTATTKDYQDLLERNILKFNFKSFTQIVILGAASYTPFMKLPASYRRAFIEDLLDIQVFSVMGTVLKEYNDTNKDATEQLKSDIRLLEQKYDIELRHSQEKKEDKETIREELNSELHGYKKSLLVIENEIKKLSGMEDSFKDKDDIKALRDKLREYHGYKIMAENKMQSLKSNIQFLLKNDSCSTCKQHIDKSFKDSEVTRLSTELGKYEEKMPILLKSIKSVEDDILKGEIKEKAYNAWYQDITGKKMQWNTFQDSIKKTNEKIRRLEDSQNTRPQVDLKSLKAEIEKKVDSLDILIDEKNSYEITMGLLKDGGIKTQIIKQYLPLINKEINRYLTKFEFSVNFTLDETFKETIQSRHREEFSYGSFSEGEKARINLAILLAWRSIARTRNCANTNLLILDEVFDSSMDYPGIENLLDILHGMEDVNIIVISHKGDTLTDKFSKVIEVVKTKNFSKIKVSK